MNQNFFSVDLQKKFRKMFVIKNKLSLSDRRGKSMHYPESPKVNTSFLKFVSLTKLETDPDWSKFVTNLRFDNKFMICCGDGLQINSQFFWFFFLRNQLCFKYFTQLFRFSGSEGQKFKLKKKLIKTIEIFFKKIYFIVK